jgi:hypothetical protein
LSLSGLFIVGSFLAYSRILIKKTLNGCLYINNKRGIESIFK